MKTNEPTYVFHNDYFQHKFPRAVCIYLAQLEKKVHLILV